MGEAGKRGTLNWDVRADRLRRSQLLLTTYLSVYLGWAMCSGEC